MTSVAEETAAGAADAKSPNRVAAAFEAVFANKVKQADLMIFSRQFAAMLKAGISLTDSLHTISHSVNNPLLRQTLQTVRTDVQRGQSLTEAMRKHPARVRPALPEHRARRRDERLARPERRRASRCTSSAAKGSA